LKYDMKIEKDQHRSNCKKIPSKT